MIRFRQNVFLMTVCFVLCCFFNALAETGIAVHFLDVGQGDAIIVQCDGHTMMIDGGDRNSNQFVYSYLQSHNINYIDYIISTHPHEDHVQGLATALVLCDAGIIYSPVEEYNGIGFQDLKKKAAAKNISIVPPPVEKNTFSLGNAVVSILSIPHPEWNLNDQSIIVKVEYDSISFLFMGDAEWEAEHDLITRGIDVSADVLKIGHHGSPTSTSDEFVKAVQPTYAIISVGADNTFGHPAKETLLKLQRGNISVFRTDIHGTIICTSDGKTIGFQMSKTKHHNKPTKPDVSSDNDNSGSVAELKIDEGFDDPVSVNERIFNDSSIDEDSVKYIGNKNSHVFHHLDCSSVREMKAKNKVEFFDREEAIDMGYKPCSVCQP